MWSVPDKGEGLNDTQSVMFQEYLDVLAAGISGIDCVLSGLTVTAQGSPNMTVAVATGVAVSNGVSFAVTGANGTITTADGTNPRIDLVVITSAGAIAVRAGTAAAAPKPPARTANDVVIAAVYVPASDTTIAANQITDMRVLRNSAVWLDAAPPTDDTFQGPGIIRGLNAGATIAQWEAVYLGGSSTWLLADANGSSTYPARGLAVAAYVDTDAAEILINGTVRNDAWAWTPGGTIYLSGTAGALTQTAPVASGDKVQAVGFALTADVAFFDFNSTYITLA